MVLCCCDIKVLKHLNANTFTNTHHTYKDMIMHTHVYTDAHEHFHPNPHIHSCRYTTIPHLNMDIPTLKHTFSLKHSHTHKTHASPSTHTVIHTSTNKYTATRTSSTNIQSYTHNTYLSSFYRHSYTLFTHVIHTSLLSTHIHIHYSRTLFSHFHKQTHCHTNDPPSLLHTHIPHINSSRLPIGQKGGYSAKEAETLYKLVHPKLMAESRGRKNYETLSLSLLL